MSLGQDLVAGRPKEKAGVTSRLSPVSPRGRSLLVAEDGSDSSFQPRSLTGYCPRHRQPRICQRDPKAGTPSEENLSLRPEASLEVLLMRKVLPGGKIGFLLLDRVYRHGDKFDWSRELEVSQADPRWRVLSAKVKGSTFGSTFMSLDGSFVLTGRIQRAAGKENEWEVYDLRRYLRSPSDEPRVIADDLSELPAPTKIAS